MSHICPDCGFEHDVEVVQPVAAEPAAEAAVEIAGIEAERDVTLAKIAARAGEDEREADLAELRGELRGMRDMLERLLPPEPEPDPEPVPVVVAEPDPEPAGPEPAVEPPPVVEPAPRKPKGGNPWW